MEQSKFYQIKNVTECEYTLVGCDGSVITRPIQEVDKIASAFTIQDAKDGDVLFISSTASHETFILKSIDEKGNAKCYFAYDSEDGFREGKYHFIGSATNCKPATKEQRDLLFQKMHEAGYEWDAEKKELKNIKQRSAEWSEEDDKKLIERLKSFRPQNRWKPSEEQMDAVKSAALDVAKFSSRSEQLRLENEPYYKALVSLYNDLEKLR